MNNYIITYQIGIGGTVEQATTTAADYTKAYLNIAYILPLGAIIIEVKEI